MVEQCERMARRLWKKHNGQFYPPQPTGNSMMSWMCEVDDDFIEETQQAKAAFTRYQFGKANAVEKAAPAYWSWCRPAAPDLYRIKYPRTLRSTMVAGQFLTPRDPLSITPDSSPRAMMPLKTTAQLP